MGAQEGDIAVLMVNNDQDKISVSTVATENVEFRSEVGDKIANRGVGVIPSCAQSSSPPPGFGLVAVEPRDLIGEIARFVVREASVLPDSTPNSE